MNHSLRPVTIPLALALCLSGISSSSCSSSSSGTASVQVSSQQSLPGYWKVWTTLAGGTELGPDVLFLSVVSGSTITGPNLNGTASGDAFQFVTNGGNESTAVDGTLESATTGTGTYTTSKAGGATETGTFRIEKFNPSGTLSVTGTIAGATVTHSSTAAVGVRDYSDAAKTVLREIEIITGSLALDFELDFEPQNLAVGTKSVGSGASDVGLAVEFSTGPIAARAVALSGTIEVTRLDNSGMAATFTLNLDTGDTLTGSFDVSFDIEAMDP